MTTLAGAPPDLGHEPRQGEWVPYGREEDLVVRFYKNATDGADHCEVKIPGDKTLVTDDVVEDRHKERFGRQWDIYVNELDQFHGQTRLELVPFVDEGTRLELRHANIHTVEQLAGVTDGVIRRAGMIGLLDLRLRAREHMETQRRAGSYEELQARLTALEGQLAAKSPKPKEPTSSA